MCEEPEMDLEPLVHRAQAGDIKAFVELIRGYQHLAFGSALALVHDLQQAEDVVQEAFLAAWSALPKLAEAAAFPGWLRGIVRHQAYRVLRRRHLEAAPLDEASEVVSEAPTPDRRLEQRREAAAALAAITELPEPLREPATLFYVHECSHQDIAVFLGIPATTVNNRLHRARSMLQQRIPTMTENTLRPHGLSDDFANRIGRLVTARSGLVEVMFDSAALPDLLSELLVSDEANKRAVSVQVVQRSGDGIVRGIATTEVDAVPRGATVLNTGQQTPTPVYQIGFERIAPLLAGKRVTTGAWEDRLIETGIKVIDVMCPLTAGGTVALAGEYGTGPTVVMEELVRRLSGGADPVSLFVLMPPFSPEWPGSISLSPSISGSLKQEGYSEGTVGPVQTFFLRGQEEPWTADRLSDFAAADVVIHLARDVAKAKIYPAVDLRNSRSRLVETAAVGEEHRAVAAQVRRVLAAALWKAGDRTDAGDRLMVERARKIQNYFAQPFFVAEPYTRRPGSHVALDEALHTCRDILEGRLDDIQVEAFYFSGGIEEIRKKAAAAQ
jgi:RNA polymerase sigma factor (sigma-70 family)